MDKTKNIIVLFSESVKWITKDAFTDEYFEKLKASLNK